LKFNKILERQIRRKRLSKTQIEDLEDLLQLVSDTYDDFEKDHNMAQRSLEISSKELLNQNRKLVNLNTNLEKLTYAAAHDLKTPLLSIRGYLQIIELKSTFSKEISKYFKYVIEGVERMDSLLTNLQRYTEIDFWKLKPEDVDLNLCLSMSIRQLSDKIDQFNTKIKYDKLPIIKSDKKLLELVFNELIKNSLTFTKPNIPPCIKITAEKINDKYKISFKDNGIGVDIKYKDYIFDQFKRLHSFSEYKGNGLGLAICKKIIKSLKGEIFMDCNYTKGLKIDIILNERINTFSTEKYSL